MRDLYSSVATRLALAPASLAATTNGLSVDLFGMKSAAVFVAVGAITGAAAFSVKLQESSDNSTWTDVPAAFVQSDAPAVLAASFSYRLGYIGGKRYIRPVFTLASGTSAIIGAVAVVEPTVRPVP
ncbi:hypothetical protein HYN69_10610 [Gemmobacter aquarius]|uniref:Uncharacterized protein n=2 Tax=Paragemmobacter aquarius TaxID=2169400 RepID=A0A2S0UR93_9RHOB|nr:hypothetical protein HYN69_10610 [Gemmobacter aquarius]